MKFGTESIAGGVLSEDDEDWARAMISAAKRLNWTIDQLIRKVEEILAYEHDESEIERLNESIDFIRENW